MSMICFALEKKSKFDTKMIDLCNSEEKLVVYSQWALA